MASDAMSHFCSYRSHDLVNDWKLVIYESPGDDKIMIYLFFFVSLSHAQDLKQPYHLLNKNNEELKRLAAVESLMEVSAEDNVSFTFDHLLRRLAVVISFVSLLLCIFEHRRISRLDCGKLLHNLLEYYQSCSFMITVY